MYIKQDDQNKSVRITKHKLYSVHSIKDERSILAVSTMRWEQCKEARVPKGRVEYAAQVSGVGKTYREDSATNDLVGRA
jgi:hypothetical protein